MTTLNLTQPQVDHLVLALDKTIKDGNGSPTVLNILNQLKATQNDQN